MVSRKEKFLMPINPRALSVEGKILSNRKIGTYHHLVIEIEGIAENCKPGNFIAISVGGEESNMPLRRIFAVYRSNPRSQYGSIIEIIVAQSGKGSAWLTRQLEGSLLYITGPLGTSFPIPVEPINIAIIGGGYGAAPLFDLAETLKNKGCRVDAVIGASTAAKIFAPLEGKRTVNSITIRTEDGSAGQKGRVTDQLEELLNRNQIELIYSCGPMGMLQAVHEIAERLQIAHQISVEESMACGIGICMTCVLPIRGEDGVIRMLRSCIDGPVIDGEKLVWSKGIPPGTLGASL
jgi:dihydroorotate dehydrogenase electron transfer subunit